MQWKRYILPVLLAAVLLLTGCSMRTVDQMYSLPKRSEDYKNLQTAIDGAMTGLDYCAPLSGENQQTVQVADLDGDGTHEYLLFAKSNAERPLRILIFDELGDRFSHVDTIEFHGYAFDLVEYVQMDNRPGVEIVVGCQLNDQMIRSVSVYQLARDGAQLLVSTNYTRFVTLDMNGDAYTDLFVLHPGQTETDNGVAEFYTVRDGQVERSNEVQMSGPVDRMKRILCSTLQDGLAAVYVASTAGETALITDVFALPEGMLTNVSLSNESGTSISTMRSRYVYADDIDNDGVIELPALIDMISLAQTSENDRFQLIRWYALQPDGTEVDKVYTYHNFAGGWYMELDSQWASRVNVQQEGEHYAFHIMDQDYQQSRNVFSIYALTGGNRDEQATAQGRFVLMKTDSVTYCGKIYDAAQDYQITQDLLIRGFRLIQQDWKTGET